MEITSYLTDAPEHLIEIDNVVLSQIENDFAYSGQYFEVLNIEGKNLLSFDDFKIEFQNGVLKVKSNPENQGGKTNFYTLIKILLFGTYYNNDNRILLEDVFNKHVDSNVAYIKGDVVINGIAYHLHRSFIRKKTVQHDFHYIVDNVEYKQELPKELIGTIKDFDLANVLDSYSIQSLLRTKQSERKDILFNLFGFEIFLKKENIAKNLLKEWQKSTEIYSYEKIEAENEQLKSTIQENQLELKIIEEEISVHQNQEQKIQSELESNLNLLKPIPQILVGFDIEKEKNNKEEYKKQISEYSFQLNDFDCVDFDKEIRILNEKMSNVKADDVLIEQHETLLAIKKSEYTSDLSTTLKDLETKESFIKQTLLSSNKQLKHLQEHNDGKCEYCGTELNNNDIQQKIKKLREDIESNNFELSNVQKNIFEVKEKMLIEKRERDSNLELKIKNIENEISNSVKSKTKNISDDLVKLNNLRFILTKNNSLKEKLIESEEIISLFEKYVDLINDSESLNVEINSLKERLQSIKNKINELCSKRGVIEYQISENKKRYEKNNSMMIIAKIQKENIDNHLEYIKIHGKKGIVNQLLQEKIQYINDFFKSQEYLDFVFSIEVDGDNVDFVFFRENKKYSVIFGSGYEKTIISLLLHNMIMQQSLIPKCNILILDEVFGAVSAKNKNKINEILLNLNHNKNVFVISHDENILPEIKTLWIQKEKNISKII